MVLGLPRFDIILFYGWLHFGHLISLYIFWIFILFFFKQSMRYNFYQFNLIGIIQRRQLKKYSWFDSGDRVYLQIPFAAARRNTVNLKKASNNLLVASYNDSMTSHTELNSLRNNLKTIIDKKGDLKILIIKFWNIIRSRIRSR
jgi:hypothetical protein